MPGMDSSRPSQAATTRRRRESSQPQEGPWPQALPNSHLAPTASNSRSLGYGQRAKASLGNREGSLGPQKEDVLKITNPTTGASPCSLRDSPLPALLHQEILSASNPCPSSAPRLEHSFRARATRAKAVYGYQSVLRKGACVVKRT